MGITWKIRGREINDEDIVSIQQVIKKYYNKGRKYISRQLCHKWNWYQSNGYTKDRACRDILIFLEKKGLIQLPSPLNLAYNEKRVVKDIALEGISFSGKVNDYPEVRLELVNNQEDSIYWNRIIHSYHYQGHKVIVGKHLKYLIYINNNPVGCLGWGSAAWSLKWREQWIGWNKETKDKNLCGIVNNIRFLILPWVKIKYLASYLLGLSVKRVPQDWQKRYGHPIYLLETFVEKERFAGTCYKAANWIYLGDTKGSAKRGSNHNYHGNIKRIFAYPLTKDFRKKLIKD